MTENQKRRMNDLLDAKRQRELEPDEVAPAASPVLREWQIREVWESMPGRFLVDFGYLQFARAIEAEVLAQAGVRAEPAELPAILFDGHSVFQEISDYIGSAHCYSPDAVSATLDAVVRLMRKEAAPTTPTQVPAAEVRAQALEEAAKLLEEKFSWSAARAPIGEACDAIRSLAQSSTADKASEVRAAEEVEYELHQDDMMVAGTSGKDAFNEILRYAAQYVQDGPIELYKVTRTKVSKLEIPAAAPSTADSGNTSALGEGADRG